MYRSAFQEQKEEVGTEVFWKWDLPPPEKRAWGEVEQVFRRARQWSLGNIRPLERRQEPWEVSLFGQQEVEIDLERTFEEERLWVEYQAPRVRSWVVILDRSASVQGDSRLAAAEILLHLLIHFARDRLGVMTFESQVEILKRPESEELGGGGMRALIERFLSLPSEGLTHLEKALRWGAAFARGVPVLLVTDGKYTLGRHPAFLAPAFQALWVLRWGSQSAGRSVCQLLARNGKGGLIEVKRPEELPRRLPGLLFRLLRY